MSPLNCSANFPLTIEDKKGRMITANQAVTLVEVTSSKHNNSDKGGHCHTELFDVKSLLYTAEEEAEYEQMLLGPGGERAATRQLASYYCKVMGGCAPSRGTQNSKWPQVLQDLEGMPTGWWDNAKEGLLWWGAVWGCCECIATLVQVLMKLVTVCRRGGDGDLDRVTLMKLVFLPGQQLVDWFPIQQREPEPAEEPVWLGDGDGDAKKVASLSWDQWGGVPH